MSSDPLAFLRGAPEEAAQIAQDHVILLGEISDKARTAALRFAEIDPRDIQQRRDEAIANLRQQSADQLTRIEQQAAESRQAIERAATPQVPNDVGAQTLHELQRARIARSLDRGLMVDQLAEAAAAAGDRSTLTALRAEVGSMNLDADQVEQAMATIEQAEEPLRSDSERTARVAAAEVAANWPNLETALAYTRAHVESDGGQGGPIVPGWERGSAISLQPDSYPVPAAAQPVAAVGGGE
jgi:hypothetical protein